MKTVFSVALLAVALACKAPVLGNGVPPESALWVPWSSVTEEDVAGFIIGEYPHVVLIVKAGETCPVHFSVEGDVFSTDGAKDFNLVAQRDLFVYVRSDKPYKRPRYSFDGETWFRARELFARRLDARFSQSGLDLKVVVTERSAEVAQ